MISCEQWFNFTPYAYIRAAHVLYMMIIHSQCVGDTTLAVMVFRVLAQMTLCTLGMVSMLLLGRYSLVTYRGIYVTLCGDQWS